MRRCQAPQRSSACRSATWSVAWPSRIPGSSTTASGAAPPRRSPARPSRSRRPLLVARGRGARARRRPRRRLAAAERAGRLPRLHLRRSRRRALREPARARGREPPGGRQIALHVAVIPATRQPARGALFYLEGGPGGAATRRRGLGQRDLREGQRVPRHRARRPARHGRLARASPARRSTCGRPMRAPSPSYLRRCFARLGRRGALPHHARPPPPTSSASGGRSATAAIDVYGSSYGATLAQLYAAPPSRSRCAPLTLDGASLPSVPGVRARGAQRRARPARSRSPAATRSRPAARVSRHARPSSPACSRRSPRARPTICATAIAVLLRSPDDCRARAAHRPRGRRRATPGRSPRAFAEHVGRRARRALASGDGLDDPVRRAAGRASMWPPRPARAAGATSPHAAVARARLFREACAAVPRAAGAEARGGRVVVPRARAAARRAMPTLRIRPATCAAGARRSPVGG